MFQLFKSKKPSGEVINLNIEGMHCTSCAISIDGELEDFPGVIESHTDYAASATTVEIEPGKVKTEQLIGIIKKLGYSAKIDPSS